MSKKRKHVKVLRKNLLEHPAVRAWREIYSRRAEPTRIAVLKERHKSGVYRLEGAGPSGSAVIAKRCWQETAVRERTVYEEVLPHLPLPALCYYGFVAEPGGEFCWLFLEDAGKGEYSPGLKKHRRLAARWLGLVHTAAAGLEATVPLPERGPDHYREHLRSARRTLNTHLGNPALTGADVSVLEDLIARCDCLEGRWGDVKRFCQKMPRTLTHGDLAVKNVRVRTGAGEEMDLFPLDWETAGWGVPAVDLAQFTLNSLSPDLPAYGAIVQRSWPNLNIQDLRQLAHLGTVFRLLAALDWAASTLACQDVGYLVQKYFRRYQAELAAVLEDPQWKTEPIRPWLSRLPDLRHLSAGLTSAFCGNGSRDEEVTVVGRQANTYASTFPSEVVTCRLADGKEVRLLCKYEAGLFEKAHGHRGGVRYEAEVYREVLQPLQTSTPAFYGSHVEKATGATWLFLQYLDPAVPVAKGPEPWPALSRAARWVGRFHALNEARLARAPLAVLHRYDAGYYRGWARRVARYARPLFPHYPWLERLCRRFGDVVALLLAAAPTVIHGEYYPHNVLLHDGAVCPIDWESAAVAAGEIDLAALTESWPANTVRACVRQYSQARWPGGAPAGFGRTLDAARVYLHFRWLGDADRDVRERRLWSFPDLRAAAQRLGMIEEAGG
jgi:aminoglycoside phosphotransferase (APT) family kinase protein